MSRFDPIMLRALRHRNYRLFFGGQMVSLTGTWMTMTAMSWLVYRLSGSAFLLGVVGFSGQFPAFLLAAVAGVYIDRWNRRTVLIVTQILAMLQSTTLAILTLTGSITIPAVIGLAVFQGMINAFDMPARQALVVQLIGTKKDLPNAIALNSSMVNVARLAGPATAGLIIAAASEGWCFLIDGMSYAAVIAGLLLMTRMPARPAAPGKSAWRDLREGVGYAARFHPIRAIILLLALVSFMGMPYSVLMPVFAKTVLHGGAHTLGFLLAASGAGALAGALWLASRKSILGLGRRIPLAVALFGGALIAFSLSRRLWLSLLLLPVAGFGFMVHAAGSNTIIQTIVDENKRGRVMSFFIMAFLGTAPVGSLLFGLLASRIGAPRTVFAGGAACLIGAFLFARQLPAIRAAVRPIYVRMGILPQIAEGLQATSQLSVPPED